MNFRIPHHVLAFCLLVCAATAIKEFTDSNFMEEIDTWDSALILFHRTDKE